MKSEINGDPFLTKYRHTHVAVTGKEFIEKVRIELAAINANLPSPGRQLLYLLRYKCFAERRERIYYNS